MFYLKHHDLSAYEESAADSIGMHSEIFLKKAKVNIEEIAVNSIADISISDSESIAVDFTWIRIWWVIYFYCS